jgi:hypothetical protein
MRKIFGMARSGNVTLQPRHSGGRKDKHIVSGFSSQHLLPGEGGDIQLVPGQIHGKGGAGGVADGQPFAVGGNPVAIGNLHAAGGAVPHKHRVMGGIVLAKVGNFAISGLEDAGVLQLELFHRVGDPVFRKTFPGKQVDRARAQKGP